MRRFYLTITLLAFLLLPACAVEDTGPISVSTASIADDPGAYYGSRVTVSGEVDDVYSPGTFTIGGDEFDEEVLVLSVDSIDVVAGRSGQRPLRRDDIVQVSGIVRPFADVDVTDHYGFDPTDVSREYGDRPVIVARSAGSRLDHVVVTARGAATDAPTAGELLTDFQQAAGDSGRELLGRTVHFTDVRSVELVGENSFWGAVGEDSLFVVLVGGSVDREPRSGMTWDVYGILREVPPATALAAEWDLTDEPASKLSGDDVFLEAIRAIPSDTTAGPVD